MSSTLATVIICWSRLVTHIWVRSQTFRNGNKHPHDLYMLKYQLYADNLVILRGCVIYNTYSQNSDSSLARVHFCGGGLDVSKYLIWCFFGGSYNTWSSKNAYFLGRIQGFFACAALTAAQSRWSSRSLCWKRCNIWNKKAKGRWVRWKAIWQKVNIFSCE